MLVLVTRALDEATRTAASLAALGHTAILSPVLEIVPTGAEWPAGVVEGILATSARGFEFLSAAPDWPAPEARRLMPLYAVGERTLEGARERGFEGRATLAHDAKTLARVMIRMLDGAAPARLIYLAGRDRKPDLETELTEAGHVVEAIEVYAAEPAEALDPEAAALIQSGEIGAALHFSRRSARLFLELSREAGLDVASLAHVAISADAAQPLTDAGVRSVRVAREPSEQAMLALLAGGPHIFVDPGRGARP
ncbi:MAG: uroporphyrinogen-III synthase [Methylocella sp.]